jgi:hypothetical protein
MVSSEVQRTLVKSPPELWAELSDPAALARHLGELGEIRIVKTKPEERVEWEADGATGTVLIKPSGWGTKVTLSVARELDEPEPTPATTETSEPVEEARSETLEPETAAESFTDIAESEAPVETEQPAAVEAQSPPEPEVTPEAVAEPEIAPHRGFFARLFRRRVQHAEEPTPVAVAEPEPVSTPGPEAIATTTAEAIAPSEPGPEPEPDAIPTSEPQSSTEIEPAEQTEDLAAELKQAEEVAAEEVAAILTAALDRLGAAHHRPFSRS